MKAGRLSAPRLRAPWLGATVAAALLAFGLAACGTGSTGTASASGGLQIWEGYTGAEAKAFAHLLAEWNKAHPTQKVTSLYVNNDNSLPKLLTAVKGGSQPDIAYVYGSWAPNIAQIPQVVESHQGRAAAGRQLERLLGRRA